MAELLNLVGLSAGVVLYAMLLAMVLRAGRRLAAAPAVDRLLLVTALLGLVWNLCALAAYELPKFGVAGPFPLLVSVGFSALGFLPAVVVHSVLRGERDGVRGLAQRVIVAVAYAVSVIAASLHLAAAWESAPVPSGAGMRLLTYTFIALTVPLAFVTRGQRGARRAVWAAALSTFAVSALHLSQLHQGDASWPVELVGHHASLPLAFAILYQDYPFALADLFLKRALALLALLTLAFAGIVVFGQHSTAFASFVQTDPRQVGVLVSLWVATAVCYPALRRGTAWFVDAVILRRPDYRTLRATIGSRLDSHDNVAAVLTDISRLLGPALSAKDVRWREWHGTATGHGGRNVLGGAEATALLGEPRVAAVTLIPTSEPPQYALTIADVTGGRRLLSDDLATLESVAISVARRIDAIRITDERYERELREQEISKLATEAELRALRAQVNPHFLFNALTTIGYLIQTAPPRALQTLMRLTSLLRAVLRSEGEFSTLGRELDVVESYLDIERARFEDRLRVSIDVPADLHGLRVPPLVLQPLVENAVKHGIAPLHAGGTVLVRARVQPDSAGVPQLSLVVQDTGAGATADALATGRTRGVGLTNVERRLACQYGSAASLSMDSAPGVGTIVRVQLPLARTEEPQMERTVQ